MMVWSERGLRGWNRVYDVWWVRDGWEPAGRSGEREGTRRGDGRPSRVRKE